MARKKKGDNEEQNNKDIFKDLPDEDLQKEIDKYHLENPDAEKLTLEQYKLGIKTLFERLEKAFLNAKIEPELAKTDLTNLYELNLRMMTTVELITSLDPISDNISNTMQLFTYLNQENVKLKLPADYVKIVYTVLASKNLYNSENEIEAEIEKCGFSFQTEETLRKHIEENPDIYIPANKDENEYQNPNYRRYYYNLMSDLNIGRNNIYYGKLFAYKITHFALDEIDPFLDYQFKKYFYTDIVEFGRFLDVVLLANKDKLNEEVQYVVKSWIELKKRTSSNEQLIDGMVNQAFNNSEISRKKQVLIFYYLLNALSVNRNEVSVSTQARFIHAVLGQPINDINNSQLYKLMKQAPYLSEDKTLIKDLQAVKTMFDSLSLNTISDMIEKEINSILKK
jgi:hypothetical protein